MASASTTTMMTTTTRVGSASAVTRRSVRGRRRSTASEGGRRGFTQQRRKSSTTRERCIARATAEDEDEFAIFRFTLGIPGFDDEDIPRVVGGLGGAALVANHLAAGAYGSEALHRSESVGIALCIACVLAPELGRRLKGDGTRSGRSKNGAGVAPGEDGDSVFVLRESSSEAEKEDCAWASYAILTNTLASGVIYIDAEGRAQLVRGTIRGKEDGTPDASKTETLSRVQTAWQSVSNTSSDYFTSRWDVDRAGANTWAFLPPTAESVSVHRPANGGGVLVVWSDVDRAFSRKDRKWLDALAVKLSSIARQNAA